MIENISSSSAQALSSTPYRRSAFGVLPPLWSSAAMKPSPLRILSNCWSFMVMYPPLWSIPAGLKTPVSHVIRLVQPEEPTIAAPP